MTLWVSAVALLLAMVASWALSLRLRDVSIVDVIWGPAFVLVAWIAFALGDGDRGRRALLAALVTIWGLRLAGYLLARKRRERREDPRYGAWRERYGDRFPLVSLVTVFLLQGVLVWRLAAGAGRGRPRGRSAAGLGRRGGVGRRHVLRGGRRPSSSRASRPTRQTAAR